MKIFGIGTDIINIKRINNSIKRGGLNFKKKIFSDREIKYCEKKKNPSAFYAKRFAAKEAFSKALGTGISKGISFNEIIVKNIKSGKPLIKLSGKTKIVVHKMLKKKKFNTFLSLSDDKLSAIATVVISL